jgi:hypothetical protein
MVGSASPMRGGQCPCAAEEMASSVSPFTSPNDERSPGSRAYLALPLGGGSAGIVAPRISIVAGSFTLNVSGSITTP